MSWTACYKDEDARALGLNNRDDLIKKECRERGDGSQYNGKWEDCGGMKFRGQCQTPNWGEWSNECHTPTTRKHFSRLWNINGSWEEACAQAINKHGRNGEVVDKKCVNRGKTEGMWGEVIVNDNTCGGTWGTFADECDDKGFKKYFSKLNAPTKMSWEDACAAKIANVVLPNGETKNGNCVRRIDGMYGEWIVPDANCVRKTSAVADDIGTTGPTGPGSTGSTGSTGPTAPTAPGPTAPTPGMFGGEMWIIGLIICIIVIVSISVFMMQRDEVE